MLHIYIYIYIYIYDISRLRVNSIWNKEELPENLKESIIVPIYKKGDKTYCNSYRGISLLPATYKILSNILPSKLSPYAEEIIGYHQCGFRRNRSPTFYVFSTRPILQKNGNTMEQSSPISRLNTLRSGSFKLFKRPLPGFLKQF